MSINYSGGYAVPRLDLGIALTELEAEEGLFIAEEIFVPFDTQKRDAKMTVRSRESMLQNVKTRRAAKGTFNRIDSKLEPLEYACDTHGLEGLVDDEERELYASDFDAELATVEDIRMALWISKERRAAAKLFSTTTFTGSTLYTDVSGANPITDPSSNMIKVVLEMIEAVRLSSGGMAANALVLSHGNMIHLLQNTGIKAMFPGAALITLQMLRNALGVIFGLEKIFVGRAMYDAAAEDAASPNFTNVWSDDYISVCRVAPGSNASVRAPAVARLMRWAPFTEDLMVTSYREEQTMSQVLRAFECVDEHLKDPQLGHLAKVR